MAGLPREAGAALNLLSPADVAVLLDRHGLAPRKADGQNFVGDPNTVRAIVDDAGLGPDDVVVEIGPGLGSLTLGLAAVAGRVEAIEIDAGLVRALHEVVGGVDGVTVHHADALETDLGAVAGGPFRVVANLPYNLATPLVAHVLEDPLAVDAYVMVQREVGERWAASPGHALYAGVSVRFQLQAEVTLGRTVSRNVFTPVPRVDSLMVRLVRTGPLDPWVREVVDAGFAQRRKTLRNNLRGLADGDRVVAALAELGHGPAVRAEVLPPADWVSLAAALG